MRTHIRIILSTLCLTILIWAYADRTSQGMATFVVPVTITPAEPHSPLELRLPDAADDNAEVPREKRNVAQIKMTLRGPKRKIGLLKSEHDYGGFALTVKVAEELEPGRHRLKLFDDLSSHPDILERGLTLQSISPETVDLIVDRYQTVPVQLKPTAGRFEDYLDATRPVVNSDKVVARVLQSRLGATSLLPPLSLSLEEAIAEELEKQPAESDDPLTVTVELESSWPGIEATFEPASVQVTLRLKRKSDVERITVRPLGVMIKTQDFFDGCEIVWEDDTGAQFTQTINVHVPITKLNRLRELESNTDAYVVIDDNDLPQEPAGVTGSRPATAGSETFRPKPVRFRFPPGFDDVRLVGPEPTVKLRVEKKTGPSELPTP